MTVIKNNDIIEEKEINEEVVEVKESKLKGIARKAGVGFKKHGKKIAAGAALLGVGLLGYALGHKTDGGDDTEYETIDDSDNSVDYETNSEEQNKIVRKGEYL